MNEQMEFPNTFDEFAKEYGFKDDKEIYTNGSELITIFRVKQWLEHINKPTQMIDKSNFDQRQYKADTDMAYECGRASVLSVIDDIKAEIKQIMKRNNIGMSGEEPFNDGCKIALNIIDKHIYIGKEKDND